MEKVITALKTLVEASIATPGSVLSDIKKVYFGDPMQIPVSCQPAITITPMSTETSPRGAGAVEKTYTVEMRLVYNQRQYYNQGAATIVSAVATYDANYKEIQVQKTAHGLQVGDSVVFQSSPAMFSGTYAVAQVLDSDNFTLGKDAGAEFTQLLSSVTYQKVDTENIFAVIDALRKMEAEDPVTAQPRGDTISGIILRNPTLKYSSTECAAELTRVLSIDYGFSTNRGFPTYEVVVKVEARRVRSTRPFNS